MLWRLMHKNISVADVNIDDTGNISKIIEVHDYTHAPYISIKNEQLDIEALKAWWNNRVIPDNRDGLKNIVEMFGHISVKTLLKSNYALSLSDQYWIQPERENIRWSDVNFFDNEFSPDIGNLLFGKLPDATNNQINFMSPDITTEGVLKKKWKIIGHGRYLLKVPGWWNLQTILNEILATAICNRIGIDHVPYNIFMEKEQIACICPNFITNSTELIGAWQIRNASKRSNSISEYEHYVTELEKLGIKDARLKIGMMLSLDYIIANNDRHFNNFGVIRNAETLEWLNVAPIFDCGNSLCSNITYITENTLNQSKPFRTKHPEQIKFVEDFSWLDFKKLDGIEDYFARLLSYINDSFISDTKKKQICRVLRNRINDLEAYVTALPK
ncbi:MAG: excisionase [Christensenellaceae bacterium]|nr:excisionase [Christensenellaceae bacterium]